MILKIPEGGVGGNWILSGKRDCLVNLLILTEVCLLQVPTMEMEECLNLGQKATGAEKRVGRKLVSKVGEKGKYFGTYWVKVVGGWKLPGRRSGEGGRGHLETCTLELGGGV